MKVEILRQSEFRRLPWKNGLGSTLEMAIEPAGAEAASGDFLWRLSRATIAQNSAFSLFPEHDRKLVILSGAGVLLLPESRPALVLHPFNLFGFSGDQAIECELLQGEVSDFNVFTRKGACSADVRIQRGPEVRWKPQADWNLAFAALGSFHLDGVPGEAVLEQGDVLKTSKSQDPMTFSSTPEAKIIFVSIKGPE